jgi:uncharacterized protein YndB with AHSA1/START domain
MSLKITVAPVRRSVRVQATQSRAFEVFTARFGAWWPKSHHIAPAEMKDVIIEPRRGGRWYEKGVDDSECVWGRVLVWEPPVRIVLSWRLNGKFHLDDEMESEVEVRFIPDGADGTRVELEHRITAVDAEEIVKQVSAPGGWGTLLELYAALVEAAGPVTR